IVAERLQRETDRHRDDVRELGRELVIGVGEAVEPPHRDLERLAERGLEPWGGRTRAGEIDGVEIGVEQDLTEPAGQLDAEAGSSLARRQAKPAWESRMMTRWSTDVDVETAASCSSSSQASAKTC